MNRLVVILAAIAAMEFGLLNYSPAADTVSKSPAASKAAAKDAPKTAPKPAPPADRVVAMYFHRTQRCPTCRKMGSYTEEAVKKGFARSMKQGKVELFFINFEDRKNEKLVRGYKISGPTLIVAKIKKNKVAEFKNLKEMWTKVGGKKDFLKYVQENVAAYMPKPKPEKTAKK